MNAQLHENERPGRINCVLIAGGKYHDFDFARLQLLKLLAQEPRIRTRVFEDFENIAALRSADILVTFTCDVVPSLAAQEALGDWLHAGGRWYALHGTNSWLRRIDGVWTAPRWAPLFAELLGSQFLSHPPIVPYTVTVADPSHEFVAGIEPFEVSDELYHLERSGDLHVLLEAHNTEIGKGFAEGAKACGAHPVLYLKHHGAGSVLYLTLGHCRGHYDMQPLLEWWPQIDRCSWDLPVFHTLLRRGLTWLTQAPCLSPAP
jgi:type 1 glutamine amidotransferase